MTIVNWFPVSMNFYLYGSSAFIAIPVNSRYGVMNGSEILEFSSDHQLYLYTLFESNPDVREFELDDPNFHAFMKYSYDVGFEIEGTSFLVYKVSQFRDLYRFLDEDYYV